MVASFDGILTFVQSKLHENIDFNFLLGSTDSVYGP